MKFEFRTEWLSQIALLAKCGTFMDVESFCKGLEHIVLGDEDVFEITDMAALVLGPIHQEIKKQNELRERRSAAGRKGGNPLLNHSLTNAKAEVNQSLSKREERKREKKDIPPTPPIESKENKEIRESTDASVDNTNVLSPSLSCSEPENSASEPAEPPIISFLLNTGDEFPITREIFDNLAEAYPAVDTMQELRKIKNWCFSNPKNRKTKGGALRFVNSWFAKEQDRGPKPTARSGTGQRRLTASEIAALPFIDPFAEIRGTS